MVADLDMPARNTPKQTLLRLRLPDGWRLTSAKADNQALKVDDRGTVDISSFKGKATIRFQVTAVTLK
jgi:streptogramin lyase